MPLNKPENFREIENPRCSLCKYMVEEGTGQWHCQRDTESVFDYQSTLPQEHVCDGFRWAHDWRVYRVYKNGFRVWIAAPNNETALAEAIELTQGRPGGLYVRCYFRHLAEADARAIAQNKNEADHASGG